MAIILLVDDVKGSCFEPRGSGIGSSNVRFQPRLGTRPPIIRHRAAADAVHFRDSPTSAHNRDSIHSGENSDIGSERVVESCTFGGECDVGLR